MEEALADDRELSQENEAEADHQTKVCLHSDFHIVCVCVCVCAHARLCVLCCACEFASVLNLQYHSVCEPLTVSKGRMQFTFLCTCTGAATNKNPCLKIK